MVNRMDESDTLDQTFAALSDPTRRAILGRLATRDMSVTELAEPFDMSLPAVSKHLRVLERAGLLRQDKEGRVRRCKLVAEPMRDAAAWEAQLDALHDFLEETTPGEPAPKEQPHD